MFKKVSSSLTLLLSLSTAVNFSCGNVYAMDVEIQNYNEMQNNEEKQLITIGRINKIFNFLNDKNKTINYINPKNGKHNCLDCAISFYNWIISQAALPDQVGKKHLQFNMKYGQMDKNHPHKDKNDLFYNQELNQDGSYKYIYFEGDKNFDTKDYHLVEHDHIHILTNEVDKEKINQKMVGFDLSGDNIITETKNIDPIFNATIFNTQQIRTDQDTKYDYLTDYIGNIHIHNENIPQDKQFRVGLLNLRHSKDTNTGHFLNFYTFYENGVRKSYIIDPQHGEILTAEEFSNKYKNNYYKYAYVWYGPHDNPFPFVKKEPTENTSSDKTSSDSDDKTTEKRSRDEDSDSSDGSTKKKKVTPEISTVTEEKKNDCSGLFMPKFKKIESTYTSPNNHGLTNSPGFVPMTNNHIIPSGNGMDINQSQPSYNNIIIPENNPESGKKTQDNLNQGRSLLDVISRPNYTIDPNLEGVDLDKSGMSWIQGMPNFTTAAGNKQSTNTPQLQKTLSSNNTNNMPFAFNSFANTSQQRQISNFSGTLTSSNAITNNGMIVNQPQQQVTQIRNYAQPQQQQQQLIDPNPPKYPRILSKDQRKSLYEHAIGGDENAKREFFSRTYWAGYYSPFYPDLDANKLYDLKSLDINKLVVEDIFNIHMSHGFEKLTTELQKQLFKRAKFLESMYVTNSLIKSRDYVTLLFLLGWMHKYGNGTPKDAITSQAYFKKSADLGNALAPILYANNLPLENGKPTQEAMRYYKMAADQGISYAQNNYANNLPLENGKETLEAMRYYKMAADQGISYAQNNYALSLPLENGKVTGDAMRYYKMAADQGISYAQNNYANNLPLENGKPTQEAMRYYKMAADQGNKMAEETLKRLRNEHNSPFSSSNIQFNGISSTPFILNKTVFNVQMQQQLLQLQQQQQQQKQKQWENPRTEILREKLRLNPENEQQLDEMLYEVERNKLNQQQGQPQNNQAPQSQPQNSASSSVISLDLTSEPENKEKNREFQETVDEQVKKEVAIQLANQEERFRKILSEKEKITEDLRLNLKEKEQIIKAQEQSITEKNQKIIEKDRIISQKNTAFEAFSKNFNAP